MLTAIFIFFIVCHLALLILSSKIHSNGFSIWWLRLLLCGVLYDNSMVMLSSIYGADESLQFANQMRWYAHSLILPFLSLFTYKMLQHAGYKGADKLWCKALFIIVTVCALSYGILHEILQLELTSKLLTSPVGEMERFVSVSKIPPLATIGTNLFAIIWAAVVWKKANWPWMFAGALCIFVINAASATSQYGFVLGNLAEVIFIASLLATVNYFAKDQVAANMVHAN
ncbi:hypothetical protein E2K93_09075 [Thalassotalea sp. HSM 43]|uniref:hypothetical protein n=1 Tax=Thalassotalea sp. HSM 43 TaxID=2552945 RepID=UPI00108051EF|nr:hypothetical protein [Thalassotalea sp. HSM 43]QBY04531.1 hypothetical protein E2K93_09075 [Thalassotalea sp. HSM 43]